MAINKRLIATEVGGGGAACTTDTLQILGDSSCVAYYKMSDATDESGSYNGTPSNVNFNVEGKFGLSGAFNGSSSRIQLPSNFNLANNSFSFSFWLANSQTSSSYPSYFICSDTSSTTTNTNLAIGREDSTGKLSFNFFNNGLLSSTSVSTDGTWQHWVCTYDASTNSRKIYINGSLDNSDTSASDFLGTSNLVLGQYRQLIWALGKIDQVRIFNKAITSTEVTTLYNEVQCVSAVTPSENFNTVIYDGDGSSLRSITGVGFAPDFVWLKHRNNPTAHQHNLFDTIRGVTKSIHSNSTQAEETVSGGLTAFNSNGFSIGSDNAVNQNSYKYVSWNWYAPTSETNTDGTITSTIKKNVDAGFSIVKYTGNGGNATLGSGLNQQVEMVICKSTESVSQWITYHKDLTGNVSGDNPYNLYLNGTDAQLDLTSFGAYNSFTSSVFPVTRQSVSTAHNNNNNIDYIAYCFHSVEGYSRIGSYKGTGATGNFVVTGFEPAFLMIKRATNSSTGGDWVIYDNKRDTSNPNTAVLAANLSSAESAFSSGYDIDFLTNGFELKTSGYAINNSSQTYIFMAFAQDPDTTPATEANSFEAKTYTGNGGTQNIVLSNGMKPDFTWIKQRNIQQNHRLFDSIRGATNILLSNTTNAEGTNSQTLTSFNSNGFSLDSNVAVNTNNGTYVAWNWKAADHDRDLATINQDGSITSLVSANVAAGFSIVKWQSNGIAGATVGHGIDTPKMIIVKDLDNARNWLVYHSAIGSTGGIQLNLTAAAATDSNYWNNTSPTSSVFSLASYSNESGSNNMIAYCFTSITGYQKIGSYTGNGGSNPIVTGFKPRFLMFKRTDSTGSWFILDGTRNTSDTWSARIEADVSNAEAGPDAYTVTVSNTGFEMTGSFATFGGANANNGTYIYLAIA